MKETREIVWEDVRPKPDFWVHSLTFILLLIFFIGFIISFGSLDSLWLFILTFLFALIFLSGFRIRHIILEEKGIWSGNDPSGQIINKIFILKQRNTFILFKNVDKLEIKDKYVYFGYVANRLYFLIIKSKDGKEYECLITDPKGFIQALKKLGRGILLTKETMEKFK